MNPVKPRAKQWGPRLAYVAFDDKRNPVAIYQPSEIESGAYEQDDMTLCVVTVREHRAAGTRSKGR